MRKVFALLVVLSTVNSFAQDKCECSRVLDQLIVKVETEYPGFKDATKDASRYGSFKNDLLASLNTSNKRDCIDILKKYLGYFKNPGHLNIFKKGEGKIPQIDTIDIDVAAFNEHLKATKDDIEGIWTSDGYKLGIVRLDGDYVAFVISSKSKSWKPKEVKFKLKAGGEAIYYWGDHTQENDTYSIYKYRIIHFNGIEASFVKEFSSPAVTREQTAEELNEVDGLYLKPISAKTLLMKIPSFNSAFTDRIKGILESKKRLLDRYDNLIIDVRGNGGGTSMSYKPIMPYIYTNPIRHLSGDYLVTRTLIDGLSNWANNEADPIKDADEIRGVKSDIQRMEGHIGEFVPYSPEGLFGFTTLGSTLARPKNVAILVDRKCGSATEMFLLDAKQCKKVKILGTPTGGAVDYVDVREFGLDCKDYDLYMPTVRMMRVSDYPLDNIGIQPDIYMDRYITDWVQYAKEYLEGR